MLLTLKDRIETAVWRYTFLWSRFKYCVLGFGTLSREELGYYKKIVTKIGEYMHDRHNIKFHTTIGPSHIGSYYQSDYLRINFDVEQAIALENCNLFFNEIEKIIGRKLDGYNKAIFIFLHEVGHAMQWQRKRLKWSALSGYTFEGIQMSDSHSTPRAYMYLPWEAEAHRIAIKLYDELIEAGILI